MKQGVKPHIRPWRASQHGAFSLWGWAVWQSRKQALQSDIRPAMVCTTLAALRDSYRGWPSK